MCTKFHHSSRDCFRYQSSNINKIAYKANQKPFSVLVRTENDLLSREKVKIMNESELPLDLKNYLNLSSDSVVLNKFMNIKDTSERIDFCLEILRDQPKLVQLLTQLEDQKDDRVAEEAQKAALTHISAEEFDVALIQLNKGLSFATRDSKLLTRLYGLRAKVYHSLGLYQQCLENVSLSNEHGHDEELERLRVKCLNALLSGVNQTSVPEYNSDELNLSYPPHPNIPFVAECIQLKVDKVYGRNLVTDRDLRPGDVIMMERPFATVVDSTCFSKCSNCLSYNFLNLIPCPMTANAMFCSRICFAEATKRFHGVERRISKRLRDLFNGETLVAFRLLVLALTSFPDLADFHALAKEVNRYDENQFSYDFSTPDEQTVFKTLCSLTTVETNRTPQDLMTKTQIASLLYTLLESTESVDLTGHEAFVKEILFQFIQATTINTFPLFSLPEMMSSKRVPEAETADFGIATYPLSSFLSHSCSPNVRKARAGPNHEIMLIFVVRPIRAGERICDCYDQQNNHMNRGLEERRSILYDQYYFVCQCEACIHDYPQEKALVSKLKSSEWNAVKATFETTEDSSQKTLEAVSTFLNEYDTLYPCNEILVAQKNLHESIRKLYTKPSFVYN